MPPRLGLIINPVAGIGGPAALKGSDDPRLVAEARGRAQSRRLRCGHVRRSRFWSAAAPNAEILAAAGPMGGDGRRVQPGSTRTGSARSARETTAADTRALAAAMAENGVDLLLFAGGDGTAVDVLAAVGDRVRSLGIPAGVKMHSAVFARERRARAGELAVRVAAAESHATGGRRGHGRRRGRAARGVDLAAPARLSPRARPRRGWSRAARPAQRRSERAAQEAIARYVVDAVLDERLCLVGPGTTTGVAHASARARQDAARASTSCGGASSSRQTRTRRRCSRSSGPDAG